jgi:signal transduction histidine kinase
MSQRSATRVAWAVVSVSVLLYVLLEVLAFMTPAKSVPVALRSQAGPAQHLFTWSFLPFSIVGALIISRRPQNPIGWLLCTSGLSTVIDGFAKNYAFYALFAAAGALPAAGFGAWIHSWIWLVGGLVLVGPLPLLFPDGSLPSARWRWVLWFAAGGIGLSALLLALGQNAIADYGLNNPVGVIPVGSQAGRDLAITVMCVTIPLSAIAVVRRFRRADGEQREQIKWFATAVALMVTVLIGTELTVPLTGVQPYRIPLLNLLVATALALLPISIGVAVLKYRLYDIDVVINKSLVYGTLAVFITAVYVAIVVGVGTLIGSGGQPNLALSIVATAIVAVAFQPVRERVQRIANRLVYGKRASPYEVLAQFSDRVASVFASEEVLARMARVVAEGTGAARADVWIRVGTDIAPAASWPENGEAPKSVALTGQLLPAIAGASRVVPVRHQGELLGALSINKAAGEPLTPVEEKLLSDLAAQAGLVLRNVRLTAELQARLYEISQQASELRASRQRIVAAQDAERRRLERNIHDGAQQNLVALTVKLRLAATAAKRNPERARRAVSELEQETDAALQTLCDLARGIYPPVLRDQGLAAALEAQASRMDLPVEITVNRVGRYSADAEAAAYFSCLEALQNVAKHADAKSVQLTLEQADGDLQFTVLDDGKGFDPVATIGGSGLQNMADRIEALGGRFEISAQPGYGTAVSGRIPIPEALGT